MPQASKIRVAPAILRWTRESIHLSKDAVVVHFSQPSKEKFEITQDFINRIEAEEVQIRVALLKEFSHLYKRPISVFFLKKPPQDKKPPTDFRTNTSEGKKSVLSPITMLVLRSARRTQLIAQELSEELDEQLNFKLNNYNLETNPINLGIQIREQIGLDLESQKKFKTPDRFFVWLRSKLEDTGIFILKQPFPKNDALAFSLTDKNPFIIVINSKWGGNNYAPKIFSLLHEYAHILLRHGGICNDFVRSKERIETFCNRFAASFLMPENLFNEELKKIVKTFNLDDIDHYLTEFSQIFKASKSAILVRFLERKLISQDFFNERMSEINAKYDLINTDKNEIPYRVYPHTKTINNKGRNFSNLVLRAVAAEKINLDAAADFLGTQPIYLTTIADALQKKI